MIINKAIVVDLDGTLSDDSNRIDLVDKNPPDIATYNAYARFDKPNAWCAELVRVFRKDGYTIFFLTGRPENMREETTQWLKSHLPFLEDAFKLLMQDAHDPKDVVEFKRNRYLAEIAPDYDVEFVVEDRGPLVSMWREVGLPCLQCADRD